MITINDLNLTVECWEFVCGLTEDFKGNALQVKAAIESDYLKHYKLFIQALTYQAIDGLMDNALYKITIDQHDACLIASVLKDEHLYKIFFYKAYENKTIARLAVLQWVFEQEV